VTGSLPVIAPSPHADQAPEGVGAFATEADGDVGL
jgi:hypothetical protein